MIGGCQGLLRVDDLDGVRHSNVESIPRLLERPHRKFAIPVSQVHLIVRDGKIDVRATNVGFNGALLIYKVCLPLRYDGVCLTNIRLDPPTLEDRNTYSGLGLKDAGSVIRICPLKPVLPRNGDGRQMLCARRFSGLDGCADLSLCSVKIRPLRQRSSDNFVHVIDGIRKRCETVHGADSNLEWQSNQPCQLDLSLLNLSLLRSQPLLLGLKLDKTAASFQSGFVPCISLGLSLLVTRFG